MFVRTRGRAGFCARSHRNRRKLRTGEVHAHRSRGLDWWREPALPTWGEVTLSITISEAGRVKSDRFPFTKFLLLQRHRGQKLRFSDDLRGQRGECGDFVAGDTAYRQWRCGPLVRRVGGARTSRSHRWIQIVVEKHGAGLHEQWVRKIILRMGRRQMRLMSRRIRNFCGKERR
jgi:hypothetical protein